MPTTTPLIPSRIRIGKRTCERVTVRSRISPLKPGAKSGMITGARRTKSAVIAPSTIVTSSSSVEASRNASGSPSPEQLGEDRDEGGLQRRVGEQAADQVGDLEGDREGRHRPADAEVAAATTSRARPATREAAVAIEKNAVERASRPAWRPGRRLGGEFLAGIEGLRLANARRQSARRLVGVDRPLVGIGGVRCPGRLQAGSVSVAIVGGRPEPARRPPGHSTWPT